MKRKVEIETEHPSPAIQAICDYFDGSGYSISQTLAVIEKDKRADLMVGRGGSHVWVADNSGRRLLVIT